MFISEQYGWLANVSGEYWDAMLDYGCEMYWLAEFGSVQDLKDTDKMLMGL